MSHGSARIESPEIVRNFRAKFAVFDDTCRNAILGLDSTIKRVEGWLKGEQLLYWQSQIRKRNEDLNVAQREYNRARMNANEDMRVSCVEERKNLDRAKRRKQEAEEKAELTKKWAGKLQGEIEKAIGPVRSFGVLLDDLTPRALSRLDRMAQSLEDYLRNAPQEKL